ncbi:MAG TPA: hypothetical protein VFA11_10475 [Acidimicrobiales bacterium]|nr:hypothetical protein [Acidimicrobiales bacterium]
MPAPRSAEAEARAARIAEQARRERAALAELDRAAARLASAEQVLAEAQEAHRRALATYARDTGAERAARVLGLRVHELRRLVKESGS